MVFESGVYGIFMKVFKSKKLINPNLRIKSVRKKMSTPHDAALLTKTCCPATGVT